MLPFRVQAKWALARLRRKTASFLCLKLAMQVNCEVFTLLGRYAAYVASCLPAVTGQLKCDATRAETRFRLSAIRTSPFKSAVASVQSTTDSRGVRISGSNAGYTVLRGSVKGTDYPLHSPFSPSLPLPCVTVCHHISIGVYQHNAAYRLRRMKALSTRQRKPEILQI